MRRMQIEEETHTTLSERLLSFPASAQPKTIGNRNIDKFSFNFYQIEGVHLLSLYIF